LSCSWVHHVKLLTLLGVHPLIVDEQLRQQAQQQQQQRQQRQLAGTVLSYQEQNSIRAATSDCSTEHLLLTAKPSCCMRHVVGSNNSNHCCQSHGT
jgi:hypothetical protein